MGQNAKSKQYINLPWEERFRHERDCWQMGYQRIAGFDEAGRGPLAGPVVAAAIVISREFKIIQVNDSKQLTPKRREECFHILTSGEWAYGIGIVEPDEIDRINIYQASRMAMLQALQQLPIEPDFLLVDALVIPETELPQRSIIHGDALSVSIAAASIIAKCTRDSMMKEYDHLYPGYGFAKHKGYPTREHYLALQSLGPSPIHRHSFSLERPVMESINLFTEEES